MRTYDILLFDLDGTLTDSAPGIFNSISYALRKYGVEPPGPQGLRKCVGPPLSYSFHTFFGFSGQGLADVLQAYQEYYQPHGMYENSVFPGVEDCLRRLKDAGYTLAVASSKRDEQVKKVIENFGLHKYFHFMAGSRDDIGRQSKSDVIRYIIDALPISDVSRALMVGDRRYDVEGARACGIETAGVLYGYGTAEELTKAGAAHLAPTPAELADFLGAR